MPWCVWRPEDNLWKALLFLHHMGLRDQIQVVGPGGEHLYLPSQLAGPKYS